jgi:hypothetical protein
MDENEAVDPFDGMTRKQVEAERLGRQARLATLEAKKGELTLAELREFRALRDTEIPAALAAEATFDEPAPIETPVVVEEVVEAPAEVAAEVAEVTPAEAVEVIAEVVELVAETEPTITDADIAAVIEETEHAMESVVAASASTGFIGLSEQSEETVTPAGAPVATFRTAAAGAEVDSGNGAEMSIDAMARQFYAESVNRQGTSQVRRPVRLAAMDILAGDFADGVASNNGDVRNMQIINAARDAFRTQRDARKAAGVKTAAPLGVLPMPVGTPYVFRDVPNAYSTTNGSELLSRIAPVPLAEASNACHVTFQLPHTKADLAGAANIWTTTDQGNVDPALSSTWKAMVTPPAVATESVQVIAVTQGLVVENCYKWTNPEAFANDLHIVASLTNDKLVSYALGRFDAKSRNTTQTVTAATGYGAYVTIKGILFGWRGYIQSLGLDPAFTDYGIVIDAGLVDLIAYDVTVAGEDGMKATRQDILNEFSLDFGAPVEVSQTEVGRTSPWAAFRAGLPAVGAAAAAMPNFPAANFKMRLINFDGWWALRPPSIGFGVIEDLDIMRQNRTAMFGEEFIGMGYDSPAEQLAVSLTVPFNGIRQIELDRSTTDPNFF